MVLSKLENDMGMLLENSLNKGLLAASKLTRLEMFLVLMV